MSAVTGGARMENIWTERENIEVRTLAFSLAITLARDARDTSAGLAAHPKPFRNQLSGSKVWHANVFNVHSRRSRDSRLTTAPRADVLRVLLGACNETRHRARGQSALFRGSLGGRNRRAGGHH